MPNVLDYKLPSSKMNFSLESIANTQNYTKHTQTHTSIHTHTHTEKRLIN